ncbi:DUF1566 domain-containing protein [Photobacterium sanguinicancri]|uniref:Lcl C-terminal domain-containing protein n=1 Tax=Photobacterium sanguinicancri TaxID=875932 RepID=UPI0024809E79|nr:DUF1566 domain-containing protein [Photobacterium sanguinicancri]
MKKTLLTLTIATLLAGCNGGSDNKISNTTGPDSKLNYTLSGEVQSNYLAQDITVCVDLTKDWVCNPSEPKTTAKSGLFNISSMNKDILHSRILAVSTLNAADNQSKAYTNNTVVLAAPPLQKESGHIINGISTLISANMGYGLNPHEAARDVKAKLEKIGVTTNNDLLANLGDPRLATIDKNIQLLSASTKAEQRSRVIATLAKDLPQQKDFITAESLTEQALANKVNQLEQQSMPRLVGNDTGVTQFYDGAAFTDIPPAGFPLQDANIGFDATDKNTHSGAGFIFTKLDAKGQALPVDATEWSCVRDERTQLTWEVKSNDPKSPRWKKNEFALQIKGGAQPHSEDIKYAQQTNKSGINTTEQYQDMVNKDQLCGINTWRLPTLNEQFDLLDFGSTAKDADGKLLGLNTRYFPNVEVGYEGWGWYWSSSFMYAPYQPQDMHVYNYLDQVGDSLGDSGVQNLCKQTNAECDYPTKMNVRMVSQGK